MAGRGGCRRRSFTDEQERQVAKQRKRDESPNCTLSSLRVNELSNEIKGRITHKRMANFNQKECLVFTLMDGAGVEIGGTVWSGNVSLFSESLQVNSVCCIKKPRVTASRGYSRTQHKYEICLHAGTVVTKVEPELCIGFPQLRYNVVDLSSVGQSKQVNDVVDIVGVVSSVPDSSAVSTDITLIDGSLIDGKVNISRIRQLVKLEELRVMNSIVTFKGVKVTKIDETIVYFDCFSDTIYKVGHETCAEAEEILKWKDAPIETGKKKKQSGSKTGKHGELRSDGVTEIA